MRAINMAVCKPMLAWTSGAICLVCALASILVAAWLFAEGQFPALSLDGRTHIAFWGISIGGFSLPEWTFYFVPTGLYLAGIGLLFMGWRLARSGYEKSA